MTLAVVAIRASSFPQLDNNNNRLKLTHKNDNTCLPDDENSNTGAQGPRES